MFLISRSIAICLMLIGNFLLPNTSLAYHSKLQNTPVSSLKMNFEVFYQPHDSIQNQSVLTGNAVFSLKSSAKEPDFLISYSGKDIPGASYLAVDGKIYYKKKDDVGWTAANNTSNGGAFNTMIGFKFSDVSASFGLDLSDNLEIKGWSKIGNEQKNGQATIRYNKAITGYMPQIIGIMSGVSIESITVALWVGERDTLVYSMNTRVVTMMKDKLSVSMDLYDYNQPVTLPSPATGNSNSNLPNVLTLTGIATIHYPANWQLDRTSPNGSGASATDNDRTPIIDISPFPAEWTTLEQGRQWLIDSFKDSNFGYKLVQESNQKLRDGSESIRIDAEGNDRGIGLHNTTVFIKHSKNNKFVAITFLAKLDNWSVFAPVVDQMLDTFIWLP